MNAPGRTTWTPLLEGRAASAAWEAIEGIAHALDDPERFGKHDNTLTDGSPGAALFLGYLAIATGDDLVRRRSLQFIEEAIDGLSSARRDASLMAGYTGVAWVVEHLQGRAWDPADDDLNEEVDAAILEALHEAPDAEWPQGHDVMMGLTGLGVYALERLPRDAAAQILKEVIVRLEKMAERSSEGFAWASPAKLLAPSFRKKYPEDTYYNLGVAHGAPGIIGFLGMASSTGIERPRAQSMIAEAVRWLLARRVPHDGGLSFPPMYPFPDRHPARSSWCYGNPGIATCLMIAARALDDEALEETAKSHMLEAAVSSHKETANRDASLCHGVGSPGTELEFAL